MQREDALALAAQIEAVEDFAHAHGQEGHGHAVRADAPGHLPGTRLDAVAQDIGNHRDARNEHSLVGDVGAQSTSKNAVGGAAGRPGHGVRLTGFHAQRQGREAVGDQVDKQKVHRVEQRKAQQRGAEHPQHLAHVGGQQELDGFADVVVDAAAFLHGGHDGGKVVVCQHHIGHVLGHVGAGDAHTDADIRHFQGGGIVDAVPRHGRDGAAAAPGRHNAGLVFGLHPGIHAVLRHGLCQLLIGEGIQLRARHRLGRILQDVQLAGNGHRRVLMVAGDHHRPDACLSAFRDGFLHLGPHRVHHAGQSQEAQLLFQLFRRVKVRLLRPAPLRRRQHPQSPVGHGLVLRQNGSPFFLRHGQGPALFPTGGAAGQHHVGGAFGVLDTALLRPVHGGHHLASRIKGRFRHPGLRRLQPVLGQALGGGKVHQRRLGGLALCTALPVQHRVIAQRHGGGQFTGTAPVFHHRHAVLGQRAGLVGTDHLGAAQCLHRGQAPDDRFAAAHVGDADGEHHRHHRGQPFRDGGHRQRHRHHEGGEHILPCEGTGGDEVKQEDEHADAQHQLGQRSAQFVQAALQRRLLLLRAGQRPGDLAHLGLHAGGGNHRPAPAVDHRGAHIAHILPVGQRHFGLAGLQ